METISCKTATFSMITENILLVVIKEGAVVDVPEAQENYRTTIQLTSGKKYASLVDGRVSLTITSKAKEYAGQPEMYKNMIAQALVITSLANRVLATFIATFRQRRRETEIKVFNDYATALAWLNEKIEQEGAGVSRS